MTTLLRIGLCLLIVEGLGLCQDKLTVSSSNISATDAVLGIPLPILGNFIAEIRQYSIVDSGVTRALYETETMLRRATHFHSQSNRGLKTFEHNGYDSLIAKYEVTGAEAINTIYVIDTTSFTALMVPAPDEAFASPDKSRMYLNRIIKWEAFPAEMRVQLGVDTSAKLFAGHVTAWVSSRVRAVAVRIRAAGRRTSTMNSTTAGIALARPSM